MAADGRDDVPFIAVPLVRRSSSDGSRSNSNGRPSAADGSVSARPSGLNYPAHANADFLKAWGSWLPTTTQVTPPATHPLRSGDPKMYGMFRDSSSRTTPHSRFPTADVSGRGTSRYDQFDPIVGAVGGDENLVNPYDRFEPESEVHPRWSDQGVGKELAYHKFEGGSHLIHGSSSLQDRVQEGDRYNSFYADSSQAKEVSLSRRGSKVFSPYSSFIPQQHQQPFQKSRDQEREAQSRFMYRRTQFQEAQDRRRGGERENSGYDFFVAPSRVASPQKSFAQEQGNVQLHPPPTQPPLVFGRGGASADSPVSEKRAPHPFLGELVSSTSDPSPLRQWFMNSQSHRRENSTGAANGSSSDAEEVVALPGVSREGATLGGGNKDWNKAWQETLELPRTAKGTSRWERLAKLAADFKATAENYARVIVMERELKDYQKTVKPLRGDSHLGIAGGQKYMVAGMLIKFCIDHKNIYGSEEQAQKVGNHEIRGANIIFSASQSLAKDSGSENGEIRVPLMVLIDFLGCRLVATSKLPISPSTLMFGSDDAGSTIERRKVESSVMKRIATSLNLKPHLVADATGSLVPVDTCADLEGHLGFDGRLYCLDTARLMPAEAPWDVRKKTSEDDFESAAGKKKLRWPTVKASHLVYQLRPKIVLQHPRPLSSDAFSRFGAHDADQHNREVEDATVYLLEEVIPAFAASLVDRHPFGMSRTHRLVSKVSGPSLVSDGSNRRLAQSDDPNDDDLIPRYMHEFGINLRYMGRLYRILDNFDHPPESNAALWKDLLLIEMVSRSVKHRIRSRCLSIRSSKALSAEQEYRGAIISEMNTVLSKLASNQTAMWHPLHRLQLDLFNRFGFYSHSEALPSCLPSHPKQRVFNSMVSGRRLFRRLVSAIGLYFLPAVYDPLANDDSEAGFGVKKPLDVIDLVDARPVLKEMAVVSNARAMLNYERAMRDGSGNNIRLLQLAAGELRNSLRALPDSGDQRTRLANVLWHLAARSPDREEALHSFSKAIDILKSAVALLNAQQKRSTLEGGSLSPCIAFDGLVTLLERALPTFARWVQPSPLPIVQLPNKDTVVSVSGSLGGSNTRSSSHEAASYFGAPRDQNDGLPHASKILAMYLEETTMTLLTGGVDRSVKAWNVQQGRGAGLADESQSSSPGIRCVWAHQNLVSDRVMCVHATSTTAVVASQDRRVVLFSLLEGTVLFDFKIEADYATCVRLMPQGVAAQAILAADNILQGSTESSVYSTAEKVSLRAPLVLACGTAYRKVTLYAFLKEGFPPIILRTIVVAYGRALVLRFLMDDTSPQSIAGYHPSQSQINQSSKFPAFQTEISCLAALHEKLDRHSRTVNISVKPRQRRSSIGGGGAAGTTRQAAAAAAAVAAAVTPSEINGGPKIDSFSLIVGISDGSVIRWNWVATKNRAIVVTVKTTEDGNSTVSLLAPQLSGSMALTPAALVRCTMIERLFCEVTRGRKAMETGNVDEIQTCKKLKSVVDELHEEVRVIEDAAPDLADARGGRETFESALPGLRMFLGRLEVAESAPRLPMDAPYATLSRMLADYEQHLQHLLTFPSPSQCNCMDLDITNGHVFSGGNGLVRRSIALHRSTPPQPPDSSTDGLAAAAAAMGVGRPFVHSEMEPHIPVYRVLVDPVCGIVCSVGKDRLLRIWDLQTGAIIRGLAATSIDVPIAVGGGVLAIVCGDHDRSFRAWGTGCD